MKTDPSRSERICRFLRDRGDGATSAEIAREVLHLKVGGDLAQERVITALLRDEDSVFRDDEGRWHLRPEDSPGHVEEVFVIGAVRMDRENRRVAAVSLRRLAESGAEERLDIERTGPHAGEWENAPHEVAHFLGSAVLVAFAPHQTARAIERFAGVAGGAQRLAHLSIQRLGKRVLGSTRPPSVRELCDHFGVTVTEEGTLASHVDTLTELFQHVRQEAQRVGWTRLDDLFSAQERRPLPIDFSRYAFTPGYLADLPRRPGVYVMRDREGRILYVGKTKNLRSRVGSYFQKREDRPARISRILDRLYHLECTPVGSDLEAQLIEARRIRSADPEINIQRKTRLTPSRRRIEQNLVAILPSAEPDHVELFLFAEGRPLGQVRMSRRLQGLTSVQRALSEMYFRPGRPETLSPEEEEDLRLARRYLARQRDSVVRINVDHVAGVRDLMARLKEEVRSFDSEG